MSETTSGAAVAGLPEEHLRDVEEVLGRRMEMVERENQRLRRLNQYSLAGCALALGLSAAVLVVAGTGRSAVQAQTVEAERFVLRSPAGDARGEWRMGEGGASELVLRGGNGKTQVKLGILADGSSGLSLADAGGSSRAALGLLPDQTTSLVFADRTGRTRAVLGYSPDGAMTLVFADRAGVTRAGLGVDATGRANLTLTEDQAAPEPEPEVVAPAGEEAADPEAAEPGAAPAQTQPAAPASRGGR